MGAFTSILVFGFLMSLIALVGVFGLLVPSTVLERLIKPMVAFSAGSLLGGAFFHMLPEAIGTMGNEKSVFLALVAGFAMFFCLEQFLNWHHCHHDHADRKEPLTYLLLIADTVHNFVGGLGIGAAFLVDFKTGLAAWIAAALHEVPQELGDFGILIYGGWKVKSALFFNFLSALTFPLAAVLVYYLRDYIQVSYLLPFAAGNFIYIAAADLIPEVKTHPHLSQALLHFVSFLAGLGVILLIPEIVGHPV